MLKYINFLFVYLGHAVKFNPEIVCEFLQFNLNAMYIITVMKYFDRTSNSLGICHGTDANRNWGYQWNTGGSSGNGCSDTYHGPEAFSEVENR